MSTFCLPCWGRVVHSGTPFEDPYLGWPPIKIYPEGHLDIEFGPFLLADKAIMDRGSFEQLTCSPVVGLERAARSLIKMHTNGYLELLDYAAEIEPERTRIVADTEKQLMASHLFRDPVYKAINTWDEMGGSYANAIGLQSDLTATTPIGILSAIAKDGKSVTQIEIDRVRKILRKTSRLSTNERCAFTEVVRPYLDHVHTTLFLSKRLNMPIFDWADLGPMYRCVLRNRYDDVEEKKALVPGARSRNNWISSVLGKNETISKATVQSSLIPKVRDLFSVSLATFEPSSVEECLAALQDNRIRDFRRFVQETVEEGKIFDQQIAEQLLHKALKGRSGAKLGTCINVFTTVASAASGLTHPALGTLVSATGAVVQEALGPKLYDLKHRDIRWLLCLADAKNAKRRK